MCCVVHNFVLLWHSDLSLSVMLQTRVAWLEMSHIRHIADELSPAEERELAFQAINTLWQSGFYMGIQGNETLDSHATKMAILPQSFWILVGLTVLSILMTLSQLRSRSLTQCFQRRQRLSCYIRLLSVVSAPDIFLPDWLHVQSLSCMLCLRGLQIKSQENREQREPGTTVGSHNSTRQESVTDQHISCT